MTKLPTHFLVAVTEPDVTFAINDVRAAEIRAGIARISDVLFAEQKFDLMIENFIELETALLQTSLQYMVHQTLQGQYFAERTDLFNRLVSNLLSATRGYLDFLPQVAHRMFGADSASSKLIEQAPRSAYDSFLGYRIMEKMRNFAQHQGLPVQGLRVTQDGDRDSKMTVVTFAAMRDQMRELGVFKGAVLAEVEDLDGVAIDLKRMTREHVTGLAQVHDVLRLEIEKVLPTWLQTMNEAVNDFRSVSANVAPANIGLLDRSEATQYFIHLPVAAWQHAERLRVKNAYVQNLHLQHVSGQLIAEAPGKPPTQKFT